MSADVTLREELADLRERVVRLEDLLEAAAAVAEGTASDSVQDVSPVFARLRESRDARKAAGR